MDSFLVGKKILIGVSGSIAAFKVAGWTSTMVKAEADLDVVMTEGACEFIGPLTFSALTGKRTYRDMFAEKDGNVMAHIDLGAEADLILIAPASANTIAKLAHGLADDLLSTTVLASRCPVIVCPAMNPQMYKHPATQANLERLREYGYRIVDPESGVVACKQEGQGRLADWETVREFIAFALVKQDFAGERLVVTAGPTREALDPARFLSNRSSGKMGYAVARMARRRGAEVVLISGPTSLKAPVGVQKKAVISAVEMQETVMTEAANATIIIKSAAVSDFKPQTYVEQKVKKDNADLIIKLDTNPDILKGLGHVKKKGQILVGFAAESENHEVAGRKKLESKNLDMIAINDISASNTGFESDTNQLFVLSHDKMTPLPLTTKEKTANLLLDQIQNLVSKRSR